MGRPIQLCPYSNSYINRNFALLIVTIVTYYGIVSGSPLLLFLLVGRLDLPYCRLCSEIVLAFRTGLSTKQYVLVAYAALHDV